MHTNRIGMHLCCNLLQRKHFKKIGSNNRGLVTPIIYIKKAYLKDCNEKYNEKYNEKHNE